MIDIFRQFLLILLFFFILLSYKCKADFSMPSCGIIATHAILLHFDKDTSVGEIEKRFTKLYKKKDSSTMNLKDLCGLINSYGLYTLPVKTELKYLKKEHFPLLLCISKSYDDENLPVGHIVILMKIEFSNAYIVDFHYESLSYNIPTSELEKVIEGKMILVSNKNISKSGHFLKYIRLFFVASFLWFFFHGIKNWQYINKTYVPHIFCFFLAITLSGCSKENIVLPLQDSDSVGSLSLPPVTPYKISDAPLDTDLLSFEKNIIDHGNYKLKNTVETLENGSNIEFIFPFSVNAKDGIVIERITTSCGCTTGDESLVGKKLFCGEKYELKFRMDVNRRSGGFSSYALITTEPKSTQPIYLLMKVFIIGTPKIIPQKIVLRSYSSKVLSNTIINVNYVRDRSLLPIQIDTNNCDFGLFKFDNIHLSTDKVPYFDNQVNDNLRINLKLAKELGIGVYRSKICIAWNNEHEKSVIPVHIEIYPSIRLANERIFIGQAKRNFDKNISIKIINYSSDKNTLYVYTDDNQISAKVDDEKSELVVNVRFPDTIGRFEKKLYLRNMEGLPDIPVQIIGYTK